ncbi:MAG: HAD-IIB family hydrolase [Dinoroseobacter sp.]|nr:HAD-IIB family hydrolase [Dinoroseobacter sp.]
MTVPAPLIVFTDLDGTLLDHDTYSYDAARPALEKLAEIGAPVILASSKTAMEIDPLRTELGLSLCPAIVENGAGLLASGARPDADNSRYDALRAELDAVDGELRAHYRGFGDMDADEVSELTGLAPAAAHLAKTRAFSEPGLWTGTEHGLNAFLKALKTKGIAARRGGRFLTLSFGGTKADRMAEVSAQYGSPYSIALGDAPNDTEMLDCADLGIIIVNPSHSALPPLAGEAEGRIRRSTKPGPDGWNAEVLRVVMDRSEV